jgi:hypothetical protein
VHRRDMGSLAGVHKTSRSSLVSTTS